MVVVGRYKNATVFRELQKLPLRSGRVYKGDQIGYYIQAEIRNCRLLPVENRTHRVISNRSNLWYADNPKHSKLRLKHIKYAMKI